MSGTVLFGDDGSPSADLAWMWINAQAWGDWRVDVLTADPQLPASGDSPTPWDPPNPRTLLDPRAVQSVQHLHTRSDPRVAILRCDDRDLIVVGPRGQGVMRALHLGSTAEWLMHNPPAPLVIARRGTPVRRAVVCADGSPDSLAAATAFGTMPWVPDVDVSVVTAQQSGLDASSVAEATAALLQGRAKSVTPMVLRPAGYDVFFHVRDLILTAVHNQSADLLVHGTAGQSRWAAMRAGSIATSLAAHAPCSVFMVHERPPQQE